MEVISDHAFCKKPIKSWCPDVEEGALLQAKNLANLPFIHRHIALMPDCHSGYGMPIGGVVGCKNVIIPNAVGVDIGCGMIAVKTNVQNIEKDQLLEIMSAIRNLVPVGFKHLEKPVDDSLMPKANATPLDGIIAKEWKSALNQLGTLGGGNHFIEIQKDEKGFIWIMIHSGSRNLGKKVADFYNKIAKDLNKKWFSEVPADWDLAFLPTDTNEAMAYISEMEFCVEFGKANRFRMMEMIKTAFNIISGISFEEPINIAHNYARIESHFKENLWIHRKGATSARVGEIGIIPGSMGSKSYIVKGLGNPESFCSCSHGAGRKMGRNEARKSLSFEDEVRILNDQGIVHGVRSVEDLDEATGAYKDIDEVMKNQADLVEILVELKPIAVIKG